jgi:HEAT repeat protein
MLDDRSGTVRFWVAEALVRLGDPRAAAPIERAMEDRSGNNRAVFAYAATMLGSEAGLESLRIALRQETGWRAFAAASALGRRNTPEARRILQNEGLSAKDREVRQFVRKMLESSLYEALLEEADSNAVHVLSHLGDEQALAALPSIRDTTRVSSVRLDAALAIRRIQRRAAAQNAEQ